MKCLSSFKLSDHTRSSSEATFYNKNVSGLCLEFGVIGIYTPLILVLGEGPEPSRLAAPEPKSGISLPAIHPFRHEISLKVLI